MKILQINSVCGKGSTGRIATDLHAILLARGHQSTIAYGRDIAYNSNETIRIGKNIDTYFHVMMTRLFDNHGFESYNATKEFISKVIALNPDVIHLHNLHGYYIHVGLLFEFLKNTNKKVIWTLHDCWAFTGHCAYFDFAQCERWKTGCYACPIKNAYPKSYTDHSESNYKRKEKSFLDVTNLHIVTPSKWLAGLAKQSFLKNYPMSVINNGIDLNVFRPTVSLFREKYKLEDKFILLGVASVFTEQKGYNYFINLAKNLKENEKLVMVGLSKNQLKMLPNEILGIASTNNTRELAEIYSAADVFVNLTLEDNFPTTNIEALACGLPVITFNSGGSPECVDTTVGIVVDRFDERGLLAAIAHVKKNGKNLYSKSCQNKAKKLFDKDLKFAEYLKLYEHI